MAHLLFFAFIAIFVRGYIRWAMSTHMTIQEDGAKWEVGGRLKGEQKIYV